MPFGKQPGTERCRAVPPRGARVALPVALAVTCVAGLVVPAGAATPEERRLEQTRRQIDAVSAQVEAVSGQQARDQAALNKAQAQVNKVLEAVGAAELAVQRQQQAVDQAKEELSSLRKEANQQERVTSGRLVEIYKEGTGAPLGAIMAADDPQEALERSALVDVVNRSDRRVFERVSASRVAVDAQREQLRKEEQALEVVLADQRALLVEVEKLRDNRAIALADTEHRLEQLEAEERHLEAESRQLAALARRAVREEAVARAAREAAAEEPDRAAAPAAAPVTSSSGWTWPASGPVTSGYGYRWGRMHEGIDVGAPSGATIVAASSGTVSYAGSMSGYGNLVLVDHGGGIATAYAHQSTIAVSTGQSVSAGQRIGSVGCTGSCTGPHLHFEVRVNGGARNPMSYLP